MTGLNVGGIVRNVPYVILMRLGDGELVEIRAVGSTSVERCREGNMVAIRMMSPKITRTHQEDIVFEDMMPLEMLGNYGMRRTL